MGRKKILFFTLSSSVCHKINHNQMKTNIYKTPHLEIYPLRKNGSSLNLVFFFASSSSFTFFFFCSLFIITERIINRQLDNF